MLDTDELACVRL